MMAQEAPHTILSHVLKVLKREGVQGDVGLRLNGLEGKKEVSFIFFRLAVSSSIPLSERRPVQRAVQEDGESPSAVLSLSCHRGRSRVCLYSPYLRRSSTPPFLHCVS